MEYKDQQTGEVLYGYSQTDLNNLIKLLWMLVGLFALMLGFMIFIFMYVDHHNILSNIVRACVC